MLTTATTTRPLLWKTLKPQRQLLSIRSYTSTLLKQTQRNSLPRTTTTTLSLLSRFKRTISNATTTTYIPIQPNPALAASTTTTTDIPPTPTPTSTTDHQKDPPHSRKIVGYWYILSGALVFGIVALGGVTRLTESGLSIVEWNLIKGMKPPTNEGEWLEEFEKYKLFPEFKLYVYCGVGGGWAILRSKMSRRT